MTIKNILSIVLCLVVTNILGQPGYNQYAKKEGLKIATKWSKAKNDAGEKKPALLLALDNTNEHSTSFSIEIRLYYEGILKETGTIDGMCLTGKKSSIGKLNGLYFIPEKFTEQQLKSSDFNLELDLLSIEEVQSCESDN